MNQNVRPSLLKSQCLLVFLEITFLKIAITCNHYPGLRVDDLSLVRLNRPPVDRHLLHHRLPNFGYAACIPASSRGRLVRLPPSVLPIVSGFFSAVYVTVSFTSRAPITPRTEEQSGFILPPLGKPPHISRAPSWGS